MKRKLSICVKCSHHQQEVLAFTTHASCSKFVVEKALLQLSDIAFPDELKPDDGIPLGCPYRMEQVILSQKDEEGDDDLV